MKSSGPDNSVVKIRTILVLPSTTRKETWHILPKFSYNYVLIQRTDWLTAAQKYPHHHELSETGSRNCELRIQSHILSESMSSAGLCSVDLNTNRPSDWESSAVYRVNMHWEPWLKVVLSAEGTLMALCGSANTMTYKSTIDRLWERIGGS